MLDTTFKSLYCHKCHHNIRLNFVVTFEPVLINPKTKKFATNITFGTAACKCTTYPIIQGVLYLDNKYRNLLNNLIHTKSFTRSTNLLLDLPRGLNGLVKLLRPFGKIDLFLFSYGLSTRSLVSKPNWLLKLLELYPEFKGWSRYLQHRLQNPTFINSLVSLPLYQKGLSVDYGSGLGHFLPYYEDRVGRGNVMAIDNSFWNLFLSSIIHSSVSHLMVSENQTIPFKHESLENITLNDCWHCISNRNGLIKKLNLSLSKKGTLVINHVHLKKQLGYSGKPITAQEKEMLQSFFLGDIISDENLHQKIIINHQINNLDFSKLSINKNKNLNNFSASFYLSKTARKAKVFLPKKYSKISDLSKLIYDEDQWLIEN